MSRKLTEEEWKKRNEEWDDAFAPYLKPKNTSDSKVTSYSDSDDDDDDSDDEVGTSASNVAPPKSERYYNKDENYNSTSTICNYQFNEDENMVKGIKFVKDVNNNNNNIIMDCNNADAKKRFRHINAKMY